MRSAVGRRRPPPARCSSASGLRCTTTQVRWGGAAPPMQAGHRCLSHAGGRAPASSAMVLMAGAVRRVASATTPSAIPPAPSLSGVGAAARAAHRKAAWIEAAVQPPERRAQPCQGPIRALMGSSLSRRKPERVRGSGSGSGSRIGNSGRAAGFITVMSWRLLEEMQQE